MTSSEQRDKAILLAFIGGYSIHTLNTVLRLSAEEVETIIRRELWTQKSNS